MHVATPVDSGLLEREPFVDVLDAAYEHASSGRGRLVLVSGEAGGGKTALLRHFCAVRPAGSRLLWGACDALFTPRPLGPIHDIAQDTSSELRELIQADAIPYQVAEALVRDLRECGRTVLVLEDIHWADEATLDVLKLLVRKIDQLPVLAIVSYRDEAVPPSHPLRMVLGEATVGVGVDRVRLPPLSPAAVAVLAEPHAVEPGELYRVTSGNPFFVTEVLASGGAEIPATVRDAVLARSARLSPEARGVLDAVAITPPEADPWLLEALSGSVDHRLDECIASGMLEELGGSVAFSHELARLAVEESLPSGRKHVLHRKALDALISRHELPRDLARISHHAEAARDSEAVLQYAPAAGAQASSVAAHREAAEQYGRALRFAHSLSADARAALLTLLSRACYLSDQADAAIDALRQAAACYRALDDQVKEGETLASLSNILWCPGRGDEARGIGLDAVELLERLPPGRELGFAYTNLSFLYEQSADGAVAREWGQRALSLAQNLGDDALQSDALIRVGRLDMRQGLDAGRHMLERAASLASEAGDVSGVANALFGLAGGALSQRSYCLADDYLEKGLAYCVEHGNDLMYRYFLAGRAQSELERGRWTAAAEDAAELLRGREVSTFPRMLALLVLALVRARRGDPGIDPLLDEARSLADPTGELPRMAPVAAARAEIDWLRGDPQAVRDITGPTLELAIRKRAGSVIGELQVWRRRSGIAEPRDTNAREPHALELDGQAARAAGQWTELGCTYEAALALAHSTDEADLLESVDQLNRLGARPAAAIVARQLRERGIRGIARGPRPTTQDSPVGLTSRETEVLQLLAQGLRNADIAQCLVLSPRTVDHHVAAILRKLDARTRGEAVSTARQLSLLEDR